MSRDDTEYFFLHIFCSRRILGSPRDIFYVGDADPGVVTGHHTPAHSSGGLRGIDGAGLGPPAEIREK